MRKTDFSVESPLLITNAVNAVARVDTALVNSAKRLSLAKHAIFRIIDSGFFPRLVIADGSGHILLSDAECAHAKNAGVYIEQLSFQQKSEEVVLFGKGQGEMQIVEYALNNSEILSDSSAFYKLSGRYFLSNMRDVLRVTEQHPSVFFNYNPKFILRDSQFTCSAFYKCSIHAYECILKKAIDRCTLSREGRLESAFFKVLSTTGQKSIYCPFPKFEGVGGTTATPIKNSYFLARNLYSRVGGLAFALASDA
jgi:hypothetical protein